ncbi:MAG: histidine kinase [Salibacteraceae bacterium]
MDGLWKLEDQQFVRPLQPCPAELTKRVRFVFAAPGRPEEIWLQSIDSKLSRLTAKGMEEIQAPDGSNFRIGDYLMLSRDELWFRMAFEGRLSRFTTTETGWIHQNYAYDELAGNRIFQGNFAITGEHVYLGSQIGTFRERIDRLRPPLALPRTLVWKVLVNDSLMPLQEEYQLHHDENQLQIRFEGISYRRRPLEFEYRMLGYDTNWRATENNSIQFTNLPPGDYRFEVRTGIRHVDMGEKVSAAFHIATPFWATWWFRTAGGLVALVAIYGVVLLRTRQVKQREQAKAEIALEMSRLELRALKAQINPHFIFNSIASVQFYLTKNQPQDAESYLQRFAELIRTVLENSERNKVSLAEELTLMRHYVGLESERFSGPAITFETAANSVDLQKVVLPPTLIQPYIENAIWHGLKPKKGPRTIQVEAVRQNGHLVIGIEDNGIGRQAAQQRESYRKTGRSFGMMIASRRVEILNQENLHPVQVHDLIDETGQARGTRVEVTLPYEEAI